MFMKSPLNTQKKQIASQTSAMVLKWLLSEDDFDSGRL